MYLRLALLLGLLFFATPSHVLGISGPVSGTWDADNSPFIIDGDVSIPTGSSLTIEAGTVILFTGRFSLSVEGTLTAVGTAELPIIFTRAASTEESKWRGIRFIGADNATALHYCIIEYARGDGPSPGVRGGALYIDNCSPTIRFCEIRHNYSHNESFNGTGGAIYIHNNSASLIEYNYLHSNEADAGGAININGTDSWPIIRSNTIENNRAHYSGGAIYISAHAEASIYSNSIRNNSAGYWGGGGITLWNNNCYSGECTEIYNNLIVSNRAEQVGVSGFGNGGGIYCRYNISNQFNNTIYANSADGKGGGIYVLNQGNAIPVITNSIVWANNAPSGPQIALEEIRSVGGDLLYSSGAEITYSNIQGGWQGTGNIDRESLFSNSSAGIFQLLPGSPAIDVGDNNVDNLPIYDLTGRTRIIDGDLNGSEIVDMGAFEFDPSAPIFGDINRDLSVTLVDTILILKLLSGENIVLDGDVSGSDVNGDATVGLAEALFTLQFLALGQ